MKTLRPDLYERVVWCVFLFYLYFIVLAGPIRYLLDKVDLIFLAYLPQMLALGVLVWSLLRPRLSIPYVLSLYALILFALLGMVYVEEDLQVLFGLYVWTGFLLGTVAYPVLCRSWDRLQRHAFVLLAIALTGVLLNVRFDYPWVGFDYTLGDINVDISRLWYTYSFERLAGFSRASFEAATQILLFGLLLMFGRMSYWVKSAVWLAVGAGIAPTTTKGIAAAYIVVTAYLLFRHLIPPILWKVLLTGIALLLVSIPTTVLLVNYDLRFNSGLTHFLFGSFEERLIYAWPEAFNLVSQHGNSLMGRGLGGIGIAQHYFESTLENSGDNLFVYLYGISGLFSILLITAVVVLSYALQPNKDKFDGLVFALLLAAAGYGVTTNVIESPAFSLFLGVSFHHIFLSANLRKPVNRRQTIKQTPKKETLMEYTTVNTKP